MNRAPETMILNRVSRVGILLLAIWAATVTRSAEGQTAILLRPSAVFDGDAAHAQVGWSVRIEGDRIVAVGPTVSAEGAEVIDLPGMTLLPGLIDAHSHVLLHPYNETPWDDQVLREPLALRVARATRHLRRTLMAGFTTLRDLGTEGAGYADVGL